MANASTVLDHPMIASRYFYPRAAVISEPYWVEAADGSRLACYYRRAASDDKTVIYLHGNGEVVSDYLPDFPEWLVRAGYSCLMAEYRGYGMSRRLGAQHGVTGTRTRQPR